MKNASKKGGFTLIETIIALGVMTILITGFLAVFGPATGSIRRSLSVEEANRLQSTLERELSIVRPGAETTEFKTSFEKAYSWIKESHQSGKVVVLYKYKGNPDGARDDGTLEPFVGTGQAGKDFLVQPMARRRGDPLLAEDLKSIVGRTYFVTMTQLIQDGTTGLKVGTEGTIVDPDGGAAATAADYPDAVIAFEAAFQQLPSNSPTYLENDFAIENFESPSFTRNLGVRR